MKSAENKRILLSPVDMDRDAMIRLEKLGLIHRLSPGNDTAGPVKGDNLGRSLYESDPRLGGHKLIVATIDSPTLRYFGCHVDCEDVWLIGSPDYRPLYFVFAIPLWDEFNRKAAAGSLTADDFICLRARYNDPEASFFVVNKLAVHGEFVPPGPGVSPSFYVTEPTNMRIEFASFGPHAIEVRDGGEAWTVG